jgi:hypothetical protein
MRPLSQEAIDDWEVNGPKYRNMARTSPFGLVVEHNLKIGFSG